MGQVPDREPHFLEDGGVSATVVVPPGETSLRAAKARQRPARPRLGPDRVRLRCEDTFGCWSEAHEVRERTLPPDELAEDNEAIERLEADAVACRAENDPGADAEADWIDAKVQSIRARIEPVTVHLCPLHAEWWDEGAEQWERERTIEAASAEARRQWEGSEAAAQARAKGQRAWRAERGITTPRAEMPSSQDRRAEYEARNAKRNAKRAAERVARAGRR